MISQHWFWLWLCAVREQAIIWANVDLNPCRHTKLILLVALSFIIISVTAFVVIIIYLLFRFTILFIFIIIIIIVIIIIINVIIILIVIITIVMVITNIVSIMKFSLYSSDKLSLSSQFYQTVCFMLWCLDLSKCLVFQKNESNVISHEYAWK